MSNTLYRKYRPQTFFEVVNQNHVKVTLINQIEQDRVGQAYLFAGPRAVGKTTLARLFAKAVNCEKREKGQHEPCNKCPSCKEISEGNSLDIMEIDAASHTGVDNVRETIIASSRLAPSKRKYRVFIIDEVHMLSVSAFNALLKTLEEPPSNVIFILATTEIYKVPSTIISRCQRFDFRRISLGEIAARLREIAKKEKREIADEVIASIARQSGGHMRDAESMLGQIFALGRKVDMELAGLVIPKSDFNAVADYVNALARKETAKAIQQINNMVKQGVDLTQFCSDLLEFLRKVLVVKVDQNLNQFTMELEAEQEAMLKNLAKDLNMARITEMINAFMDKKREVKSAEIPQLPLEVASVELTQGGRGIDIIPQKITKIFTREKGVEEGGEQESNQKVNLQLEDVEKKWPEFIDRVRAKNSSLAFILKVAKIIEVKKDKIKIAVGYKLHQEKICQKGTREKIEEHLSGVFGGSVRLDCSVEKDKEKEKSEGVVKNILNVFGGRVVD